jgi:hypothetical protein
VAGEQLEMGPLDVEQPYTLDGAPFREQSQIGGVADPSSAGVAGQETGHRYTLGDLVGHVVSDEHGSG